MQGKIFETTFFPFITKNQKQKKEDPFFTSEASGKDTKFTATEARWHTSSSAQSSDAPPKKPMLSTEI